MSSAENKVDEKSDYDAIENQCYNAGNITFELHVPIQLIVFLNM